MSLAEDSPLHSSSSDDFASILDAELKSSSSEDASQEEEEEDNDSFRDSRNEDASEEEFPEESRYWCNGIVIDWESQEKNPNWEVGFWILLILLD